MTNPPPPPTSKVVPGFSKSEAFEALNKCTEDEPVFLLRAQDVFFVPTVLFWITVVMEFAGKPRSIDKAEGRKRLIGAVRDWQAANKTKAPD